VLRWRVSASTTADNREHFYVDVPTVLSKQSSRFKSELNRAINRFLSIDTSAIVSLADTGSNAIASEISKLNADVKQLDSDALTNDPNLIKSLRSVLVVAGAITSGRKLLALSRLLRDLPESATITYLVGFAKLPSSDSLKQLKSDLEQGGHAFHVLRPYAMPRITSADKTSWDYEHELLIKLASKVDPLFPDSSTLPSSFQARYALLEAEDGTPDNLFLQKPDGQPLKLRKSFVFWIDFPLDIVAATQADVYWTISAILHDLRLESAGKSLGSVYHTTLISPVCFDRFNDGVIQACLLRAALPAELNYSVNPEVSRQMTDIVISVLTHWQNQQGEAALEFLLALACGRLLLTEANLVEITKIATIGWSEEMRLLMRALCDIFVSDSIAA
jgi:hypothetical protein